jgi:hypothetical protein
MAASPGPFSAWRCLLRSRKAVGRSPLQPSKRLFEIRVHPKTVRIDQADIVFRARMPLAAAFNYHCIAWA